MTGRRPSGVDCNELFVPIREGVDSGLFREEELLMAEAGVTVRGTEVMMKCFEGIRASCPWGDGTRRGGRGCGSPLRTGEAWAEDVL